MIDTPTLLDRFLRYVKIDTQADETSEAYPSTPGQLDLSRLLVEELREMGLADAEMTDKGIAYATLPATVPHAAPTIAWNSHVDTSPETSGRGVKPHVIENYAGGDIPLPGDPSQVIRVADSPELLQLIGKTIITTDGTTLLGADDKAGVAVIMEAVAHLAKNPDIPHGPIRALFTCDEEIGKGVDHVDLAKLNAACAYTLDGGGTGEVEWENFSADKAVVTIKGVNIHPSIGKGKLINAVRLAGMFLDRLPRSSLSPETTEGREGFLHPYVISGGVAETRIDILLRDFETDKLAERAEVLRQAGRTLVAEYPGASVAVAVRPQYRNMAEGMAKEPRAVPLAEAATRAAGLEPVSRPIRGGTDGARLTELGLPTPNLSTGEHNQHSPLEWTCLQEMQAACTVLVELAKLWGREKA